MNIQMKAVSRSGSIVAALFALVVTAQSAFAQEAFPNKPVRIIVTSAPGVVTDLNARVIATKLATMWSQPVVVENKVGGNQIIGTDAMVKSAPDGSTLLLTNTSIVQNPATRPKDLPFDTLRDIAPVTQVQITRIMYAIDAKLPVKTVAEFIALAKANPGKFSFGSYGSGSTAHMMAAKMNHDFGVNIVHVPYNGPAPAVRALLAGEVASVMSDLATLRPALAGGQARIIATTGGKRSPYSPEIPTFEESGVSGFAVDAWGGIFAPGATPEPVLNKISADIGKAIAMPDVQAWYKGATVEPVNNTPAQFREIFRRDIEYWTNLIRNTGIKLD